MKMSSTSPEQIINELQRKLDIWMWLVVLWEWTHWILGIAGITFSALNAAPEDWIGRPWHQLFSIATTVCLGVMAFTNPQVRSSRYMRSYVLLDTGLRAYKCDVIDIKGLLVEHRRSEELLTEGGELPAKKEPPSVT